MSIAQAPIAVLRELLAKAEGHPAAMIRIAALLRDKGEKEQALAAVRRAQALAPHDPQIAARARVYLAADVPRWHFNIVRDQVRNDAYDRALRRAIKPGMRVLEIGTGTGILAMMAARAGAAQVITCEMNPTIAAAAREVIARNGYSDRVRVIGKHSEKLDVEADLGGRMDLLVSEIVSNDLLAEHVLDAHEHAVRELLKPGAPVIPARGRIRVAPAEMAKSGQRAMTDISGFDLSPFEALRKPVERSETVTRHAVPRGPAIDLFEFDFATAAFRQPETVSAVCESHGGRVDGLLQWISLTMDDDTLYENTPAPDLKTCWAIGYAGFPAPVETVPGQLLRIAGLHDRLHVYMWGDQG